ncbi:UxaA family hydrolase [Salibacterium aidingense]|uniref:UxaA family hydrolase n=1 Tax=Salibacterium aidingense TaxID=384933 RepID=UPI003BE7DF70
MKEKEFNALILDERDNIVVMTKDVNEGDVLYSSNHTEMAEVRSSIPKGHKAAAAFIPKGNNIIKYGESSGIATKDIEPGSHVHTDNVRGLSEEERQALRWSMNEEECR